MKEKSPDIIFEDLFEDLHLSGQWKDGKLISDAIPRRKPAEILDDYHDQCDAPDFDIGQFFEANFSFDDSPTSNYKSDTDLPIEEHIEKLWEVLRHESLEPVEGGSALPLPFPYIVPGGRFKEIYYWDSYFTMLGLKQSSHHDLIRGMLQNFAYMIERYGFIPNGNRSYFLSRSQPPFFSLMVRLLAEIDGKEALIKYRPHLEQEYNFWMNGHEDLENHGESRRRVVQIEDGYLNRYFDKQTRPRPEMYGIDIELFKNSGRDAASFYRSIRAACESGWDFSSRWLSSNQNLNTIHTTHILPVDLNCLLYHLEWTLSDAFATEDDELRSEEFKAKAELRKQLINKYFWEEDLLFYMDYDFRDRHTAYIKSLAAVFPLYFEIADQKRAGHVAQIIEKEFLHAGGLITTTEFTGQQWDAPNGWAPLQWMSIKGLRKYGFDDLADEIQTRWLDLNRRVYARTGKMMEKYNVIDMSLESGGGEYPVQDGFGWTNGVFLDLSQGS
jgi:alpha,alpha-trehalase